MTFIIITTVVILSCLAAAVSADHHDGPSVQDVETEKKLYGHFH